MELTNQLILIGAGFLVISIVASAVSTRLGAPLLLVFLLIGMLAGEDGPGRIQYNDISSAHLIGTLALAIILFDGGLRTRAGSFRVALWPAVSLATIGVVVTAAVTGAAAAWILGVHWLKGMLLGAIVGSTDAAAVFSLLHVRGMELKQRVGATLEIESGSNDPMAVFLTIALIEIVARGQLHIGWDLLGEFVWQMGVGALLGIAAGHALGWLINRLELATGLYPLLAMAGGLLTYGVTSAIGASGFLAIYLAGVILGNHRLHAAQNILRVHDGLAWLSQIIMFLVLGLLVTPHELVREAMPALLIALVLMLVARPLAVWISLLPFRFPWREQLFIAWVGLRGAVPIILALFPLLAGLPEAWLFFNVAFFVVLISLLIQGWTVAPMARWLGLQVPAHLGPVQRVNVDIPQLYDHEFVGFRLSPKSVVPGQSLAQMHLPESVRVMALVRGDRTYTAAEIPELQPGDYVYLIAPGSLVDFLSAVFAPEEQPAHLEEHTFFGDFTLNGDARLGDVASMYGIEVDPSLRQTAIADYLARVFKAQPVVGDRTRTGGVEFVVREMEGRRVSKVGVVLRPSAENNDGS